MLKVIVISCSLHPQSRSILLARQVVSDLQSLSVDVTLYDLRGYDLAFCNAVSAHRTPEAQELIAAIGSADAVLLAAPIYNYDVNAAAKNLLELGLRAWNDKLVGFICVAGSQASYMSVMSIATSLMLDFRCIIIPRFVYATGADFGDDRRDSMYLASADVRTRLQELAETTLRLGVALKNSRST